METGSQPPTSEQVEALFNEGGFLDAINWRLSADTELLARCVELHNMGSIDLLTLPNRPEFEAISGHPFFAVQHFLDAMIPRLEAPVDRMMEFVTKLVSKGGSDGAAHLPNQAFIEWCAADPVRAREVIAKARGGEPLAVDHLAFALQSVEDLAEARRIAIAYDDFRRLSALTAISRLSHAEPKEREATVDTLAPLLDSPADDALRASVLEAVVSAFASGNATLTPEALAVVKSTLAAPGDHTLYRAALVLWSAKAALSAELIELLLSALTAVNPAHKGTIGFLDQALSSLVERGFDEPAINFVTDLLSRPDSGIELSEFNSFATAVLSRPPATFNIVVMRWLLTGVPALCDGLEKLFRARERSAKPLDLAMGDLPDAEAFFVCRKAVGYFFMQPVVAGSILVSTLRTAGPDLADAVGNLLFDPLLVNYSGELREYLEKLEPSDPARARVRAVLDRADAYVEGLRSTGRIKELHPSEHRRQLERTRWADQMRKAMKDAHKESVFYNLMRRSVLLYGRRSVTFVSSPSGERQAVEMDLQSHGVSHEWPRQEIVDPVGLDEILKRFRFEQIVR